MILDEIVLHNFGVYRGRQVISLAPPSPTAPVVLFGGLNGGGKTTLLDGVQLALYGKLAKCSNRGTLGYEEFLRRCVNRATDPHEGSAVELQFRYVSDGEEHTYRVHRSWAVGESAVRERLEVVRDGVFDRILTDSWHEAVEEFIPARLSQLFFFDGERIEALADFEHSAELLGTAVHSLLGLDLVDQLGSDLVVLERRKRAGLRTGDEQQQIDLLRVENEQLAQRRAELVQQRAAAQNELDQHEKRLRQAETRFQAEGGDLFSRRQEIEAERVALEKQLRAVEEELRDLAAGPIPLLLVTDLLETIDQQDRQEEHAGRVNELGRILAERDAQILKVLRSEGTPKAGVLTLERFLSEDRKQRGATSSLDLYIQLDADTRETLRSLRATTIGEVENQSNKLLRSTEALRRNLVDLDRELARTPEGDALASLIDRRETARLAVEAAKRRLELLDLEVEQLKRDAEHKEARLVAQIEEAVGSDFAREDTYRIVTHSERVRETLTKFRSAVVHRHVHRIERLVLDSLRQLLRKESLISDLRIDPERFSLELRGPDAQIISSDRLSAGERQLLAVSILWGLARASGRPLPVVIDTPLGRLDSSHRRHLVERYFPNASHQVVLLSTDEEIDERYYQMLRPWVGRTYTLAFDDSLGATHVQPGYFWEEVPDGDRPHSAVAARA